MLPKGDTLSFASQELIRPCVLAGCPPGGTVLDPFGGAGTTAVVAEGSGRNSVLVELNPDYVGIAERRIRKRFGMMLDLTVDHGIRIGSDLVEV